MANGSMKRGWYEGKSEMREFRPRGPEATSGNLGPSVPQDSQRTVLLMDDSVGAGKL